MSADQRQESLTLTDGTQLVADIWRPVDVGPWPVLLMRQPYGRRIASTVTLPHPSWWASKGYLVVIQDVRGQGASGGTFGGFAQEAADTAETHAWIRNLPDCNGKLGCFGFSYQGLTQLVAPEAAPPPDCLAPAMAGLDERRHWSSEGDAHWWHLGLGWGLQLAALQAARRGDAVGWQEIRRSLEIGSYLRDGPDLLAKHDPDGMARGWLLRNPSRHQDWMVHQSPSSWLRRPMLLIGGWWDPHLLGVLDLWNRSRAAGGQPQLAIGPATHLQWWPEVPQLLLNFFDQHLKNTGAPRSGSEPRLWNLSRRIWQKPQPQISINWSLSGDQLCCMGPDHGQLQWEGPGEGEVCLVHDPWRPAPAIGGHLSPSPGPAERSGIDARTDVATFTSQALSEPLTLQGQPQLSLDAHADQPGFDLCLALSRLPAGSDAVEQLSTGVTRLRGAAALEAQMRCVQLQPLLTTLEIGDRLRLSIAPAAWPAIGVNPGDPTIPEGAPTSDHRIIVMTLRLAGSSMTLNPLTSGKLCVE